MRSLFVCLLLLFAASGSAAALDPDKFITQYGHTAWRVQDGYFTSPTAIAQTADGYIWLGTRNGLLRFDGVKFTAWTPPAGQSLPGSGISVLLGASDGSLWIGTTNGIAQFKDNQIISYPAEPRTGGIGAIIEDETKTVWFTRYRIADGKGPLCSVKNQELRCHGKEDGVPVNYGLGLAKDAAGNIWFGSRGLCRWSPESSDVYFEQELKHTGGDGVIDVAADSSGTIWAALDGVGSQLGVRRYRDGKWSSYAAPGFDGSKARASVLYVDRNNSLWVGATGEGLYRIHDGIADSYKMENGLSGNYVGDIFEDREGNLWVQTENGVDMFRDTSVVSFSTSEGLSSANINSILALGNNSIWAANQGAVDIILPGSRSPVAALEDLPGRDVGAMLEDRAGRVLLGVDGGLMIRENNRFSAIKKPDGSPLGHVGTAWAMSADDSGNIWVGIFKDNNRRLLRIKEQIVQKDILLNDFVRRAESLAADKQGAIWIGSARDKIVRYDNGQTEIVSFGDAGETIIFSIFVDSDDALWAATVKGLYRWKDGVLSLLDSRNNLPCSSVYAALADDAGNFWLYAQCGLLKVPAADIAAWRQAPESKISVKTFDALDGATPSAGAVAQLRAAKSPDGRLWFTNGRAVQMIDPNRVRDNTIPPPVLIEELIADHKEYRVAEPIAVPPLHGELEINYTALSYAVPRKINFRYKLEGHDAHWHDAGTRRQAFYNNLSPGQYRFRVIAGNGDGVWNETGAALDFIVEPAWHQTTAFSLLCLFGVGLIAWSLYQLRIRRISRIIGASFDARLAERTRLARELHDTFLQTIQGSKLVADDALEKPDDSVRMRRAMEQLSVWLGRATDEGRAALKSLRTTTVETNDLAEALRRATAACRLAGNKKKVEVAFAVVGKSKEMHPIVRDEIFRIGYEAIGNAAQHSRASRVQVKLNYARDLTLSVEDNGVGIDPLVAAAGKTGHFGLQGMRERAARINGKLTIKGSPNSGTEIKLVVPGGIGFRKPDETPLET